MIVVLSENDAATTTLRTLTMHLTGSLPGPESSLPALSPMRALPTVEVPDADPAMAARVASGRLSSPLPYARHSDYTREDDVVELPALVLENEALTATVLPSLGGRVWSLRDRIRDRELLFVNPRLRFANFGLTDGWFAGGIEWNLGSTGHWTLSSRPLHAARIDTPTGDGLRLWEWERTRDLMLQVDLALDGDRLLAHTRVINPDPEPKPLYYWTNVAVLESAGTRVLTSAQTAWRTDYSGRLTRVPVPHPDSADADISYPATASHAADYFFETDAPGRFVAAIEPDGRGFAQTATDGLRGRKLFLWGSGPGGDRWQEWLSGPDARYAEIQAGWCTTQLEHDLIAGHGQVSWTEAFGALDLAPDDVAAPFAEAAAAAARALHDAVPPAGLDARHAAWLAETAGAAPLEISHVGSGWGAIEIALRASLGETAYFPTAALPFPTAADPIPAQREQARPLGAASQSLSAHSLPLGAGSGGGGELPGVSDRWRDHYADAARDRDPWTRFARGTNAHVRGDLQTADAEYAAAIDLAVAAGQSPPVGAVRGRALLAAARDDREAARSLYASAVALAPDDRLLLTEAVTHLLASGAPAAAVRMIERAPAAVVGHGRTWLLRARALLALGDRDAAAQLLDGLEVPDLAEGGRELDELWTLIHPGEPLPARLDFRMQPD